MKERFFLYTFMVMIIGVHAGCEQGKSYYAHSTFENHEASHRQNSSIDKVVKSDDEWKEILTSSEYRILRNGGTEFPIVNEYNKTTTKGIYHCAACDLPIFDSETKYDSGSGWPAFYAPLEGNIITKADNSFFMQRTEVLCARCDSHLGHVFEDGPEPTGLRYCINSVAMNLQEEQN